MFVLAKETSLSEGRPDDTGPNPRVWHEQTRRYLDCSAPDLEYILSQWILKSPQLFWILPEDPDLSILMLDGCSHGHPTVSYGVAAATMSHFVLRSESSSRHVIEARYIVLNLEMNDLLQWWPCWAVQWNTHANSCPISERRAKAEMFPSNLHRDGYYKLGTPSCTEIKEIFLEDEKYRKAVKDGIDDVVAIMIPEPKGKEIVSLLERNITVMMHITIGTRNLQKYVSRTSVVFVSISFIVLMIISLAWLVFYYIQRFRYANARDRNQRRLGDAAKKAISKLQVRTIRKGDKETEPDFDNCAVCIEGYKPNDVVRILPCRHLFHKSCVDPWLLDHRTCPMCKMNILKALGIPPNADCVDDIPPDFEASIGGPPTNQITGASDITVNESSVALDPPVRTVGVLQVIQDADPLPQTGESNLTTSSEQEPAVSSDSDISLIMAMEVGLSDVELSTDQDCEEVKS
ncbi:RING finger protein 150 [Sceloporus undulatus]|uniref:RING finger protein 150 n=1 Tax=Sceloporus undulatus TaxID=8520 RepID=UPI001C4D7BEA|nr:RING finger protein 150 [Sceloporus undulatus]